MVNWLEQFAPEFEPEFYGAVYPDLRGFDPQQLLEHYENWGRAQGRQASRSQGRGPLIQAIQHAERALEIGPFHNPLLEPGPNTFFLDVFDSETLKVKGLELGLDISRVPPIDFVSPGSDLDVVDGEFDLILSSHSLEHQTDLVRHLQSIESRLRPGGAYVVLVPDCRYCFDHFRPPSNISHVLEAYRENRRVHTLAKVIEHAAYTTHNESDRHWHGDHGEIELDLEKITKAMENYDESNGGYIDVHNWQLTASVFREITELLYGLELIGLRPARVYDSLYPSNEFSAVLIR